MFNCLSFAIRERWGTLSNAFWRSKKMAHTSEPLSRVWCQSWVADRTASVVDLPGRKPHCLVEMGACSRRWSCRFFLRDHPLRSPYHIHVCALCWVCPCCSYTCAHGVPMVCPCNLFILAMPLRYAELQRTVCPPCMITNSIIIMSYIGSLMFWLLSLE